MSKKKRIKRKRIEKVTSSQKWSVSNADYHKGQKDPRRAGYPMKANN